MKGTQVLGDAGLRIASGRSLVYSRYRFSGHAESGEFPHVGSNFQKYPGKIRDGVRYKAHPANRYTGATRSQFSCLRPSDHAGKLQEVRCTLVTIDAFSFKMQGLRLQKVF